MSRIKPISVEDAERAIYIDFEETATDPPSFLRAVWADEDDLFFEQYVIEEALWPSAMAKSPEQGGFCRPVTWDRVGAIR